MIRDYGGNTNFKMNMSILLANPIYIFLVISRNTVT